ncbi:hypothetical protein [Dermatobacter hominis]|uniref:hypothetical protein n=1 Tax=Dermatobacter hominis TaxID=2884263 RepID=UPI001D109B27|nr:hypothetical protein [Dermatobacter hominis]UDY34415.1 hypothetical protein LH044_13845 [Dermatobacter hominis]
MLLTLWSVKGGSGTSTVAAGLASVLGRGGGRRTPAAAPLLVDLAGDQPALLGLATPATPGVRDWLATDGGDAAALRRLEVDTAAGPALVPAGAATGWPASRSPDLVDALRAERRPVVVDGGTVGRPLDGGAEGSPDRLVGELTSAGTSLLVVRPCYLALRRAVAALGPQGGLRADGIVLVAEPGRALDAVDVARAVGVPVRATVAADPAVARAVDAGLLAARLPRSFGRSLDALATEVGA